MTLTYLEDDLHISLEPYAPLRRVHGDVATDLLADVVERRDERVVDAGAVDVEYEVLRRVGPVEQTHTLHPLPQLVQLLLRNNEQMMENQYVLVIQYNSIRKLP